MSLRLRRGTDTERQAVTFLEGELIYVTDTKALFVGDGNTAGGVGFTTGVDSINGEIGVVTLNTDDIPEGNANLYYSNSLVDAYLVGGTGVTISSGDISIGQAVGTTDNVTFADIVVTGNLTVQGTQTIVDSTTVEIADATFRVNSDGAVVNAGLEANINSVIQSVLYVPGNSRWEISSNAFANGSITATSFSGEGSDITNVRAETIELTVKNATVSTIDKGTPIYQTGSTVSGVPEIAPADAGDAAKMPAIAVAGEQLIAGAEGRAILMGQIAGIDTQTAGFQVGDVIFVAVGGGYANVAPQGEANLIQNLGIVTKVDLTNGGGEVYGAGRAAATPNLDSGNIFIGGASNTAESQSLVSAVTDANIKLKQFAETVQSLGNISGNVSPDVAIGTIITGTLTGDITLTGLTNASPGVSATLVLTQDGTGSRTLTAGSGVLFLEGNTTLSSGAGNVDIVSMIYDGTNYYATLTNDYK